MELLEAIKSRKSIRAYKADPVPISVLTEILDIARWTPSSGNTQPWEFIVVTKEALEKLSRAVGESYRNPDLKPHPDIDMLAILPKSPHARRRQKLFKQISSHIEAEEGQSQMLKWFELAEKEYGAQAYIIIVADKTASGWFVFDIGLVTQTIALAAQEYDLGTCIMSGTTSYPDVVRKVLNIPKSKQIVIGIAIGYPDWNHPLNSIRTEREAVESMLKCCNTPDKEKP